MKIQLHSHTRRYSQCAGLTPYEQLAAHIRAGYGALYLTEHDHVWSDWELEDIRREFQGIALFPGVELSLSTGSQHLLVLGTNDDEYVRMRNDVGAILDKARQQGHLTVLAHPFRWEHGDEMLRLGLLPDALEYRTPNHDDRDAEMALDASQRLGLPLINVGDVHNLDMVDKYWIETSAPIHQADDIRGIVLSGNYRNAQAPQ